MQYQILSIKLSAEADSDPKATRLCVVLSPNVMNKHLKSMLIAPMTSEEKLIPTRIEFHIRGKKGWIALDQIRTIQQSRIATSYGLLSFFQIEKVKLLLQEMLVD